MVRFVIGILLLILFLLAIIGFFTDPGISDATGGVYTSIIILFIPGYLLVRFGWFAHSEKKRKKKWHAVK